MNTAFFRHKFPVLGYSIRFVVLTFLWLLLWASLGYILDVIQAPRFPHWDHMLAIMIWIVGGCGSALIMRYSVIKSRVAAPKS